MGILAGERARKTQKLVIVTRQALVQLRLKRRILGRRQRQLAGLDGDEERIDAGIGLGGAVDSGRTDRQRPRRGLVMQRSPRHAAIQRQSRRQLKTDEMVSGRRAEMRAALEPHAEHRDPAFARRAARCNRDRRTAIILGQVNFTEFHHADVVSSGILVRNNARKTLVLASWSVNLFS